MAAGALLTATIFEAGIEIAAVAMLRILGRGHRPGHRAALHPFAGVCAYAIGYAVAALIVRKPRTASAQERH